VIFFHRGNLFLLGLKVLFKPIVLRYDYVGMCVSVAAGLSDLDSAKSAHFPAYQSTCVHENGSAGFEARLDDFVFHDDVFTCLDICIQNVFCGYAAGGFDAVTLRAGNSTMDHQVAPCFNVGWFHNPRDFDVSLGPNCETRKNVTVYQ
jgi:hypothetical protein